jgi:diguanylate cyclase (GGDEF)-like protein
VAWLKPERVWAYSPHPDHEHEREAARQAVMAEIARLPFVGRKTDDVQLDADLVPEPPSLDFHPTLTVPMMVGAGQVGLMRLERRDGPAFTDHEAELLKVVAGSLALALRNAEAHSHVQTLAMTDGLTGLLNRRAFMYYLERELKETERFGTPLALLMMDLDHFKTVNDRYGHLTGDRLLNEVAGLLSRAVRAMDVVTRYGGEEFALILRRTALSQATVLAERIRAKIDRHAFVANDIRIPLTMSMGIVTLPNPQLMHVEDLIAAADKTLYQAKARGRNRVEVYEPA